MSLTIVTENFNTTQVWLTAFDSDSSLSFVQCVYKAEVQNETGIIVHVDVSCFIQSEKK